jgi:hypothetical protein
MSVSRSKVKVGFFSFTEITDPGEHLSYNAWHQLDHMPEQFPLPGIAYGQRWVSTPACRAARVASGALLDSIHYMTLYLIAEPVEDTLRDFRQLGRDLYDAGRFHHHRRAHLSGPFALVETNAAPRVLISAEAVPYRPHRGVYVVVQDRARTAIDTGAWCAQPGVAGVWVFADDARRVTVAWLDEIDPVRAEAPPGTAGADLAGPMETITPWQWDWFA